MKRFRRLTSLGMVPHFCEFHKPKFEHACSFLYTVEIRGILDGREAASVADAFQTQHKKLPYDRWYVEVPFLVRLIVTRGVELDQFPTVATGTEGVSSAVIAGSLPPVWITEN